MTPSDVDAFFSSASRSLPAEPDWSGSGRLGERRAYLPIAVDGVLSDFRLHMTVHLPRPEFLVAQILAGPPVCRLCLGAGHFDRLLGKLIDQPHFHPWPANRPSGIKLPKDLDSYIILPVDVTTRSQAFAWFLEQNAIDLPTWLPISWPNDEGFL